MIVKITMFPNQKGYGTRTDINGEGVFDINVENLFFFFRYADESKLQPSSVKYCRAGSVSMVWSISKEHAIAAGFIKE